MKKFIKYIGNRAINGHSIAKYKDDKGNIILKHEYIKGPADKAPGKVLGTKVFTQKEYNLEIPNGNNTLASMLDTFFGCNMLER